MSEEPRDPVINATQETNPDTRRVAVRQARWRMSWKFLAVLAVLFAFTLLRAIEGEKRSFDEERGRPVVIVNDSDADQVAAEIKGKNAKTRQERAIEDVRHDARLLKISDVENVLDKILAAAPGNGFDKETVLDVKETLQKIKYQNFKDEREIVSRLEEEIMAAAEYKKRALLVTQDLESKKQASKLPDLSQEELPVRARLEEYYRIDKQLSQQVEIKPADFEKWIGEKTEPLKKSAATDSEIGTWRSRTPGSLKEDELLRWLAAIHSSSVDDVRVKGIQSRITDIDYKAQEQIRVVYTGVKPKLPELLKGAVNAPPENNSLLAFFSPRSVLDEKSGIYVVYQTLWLACVMVLVFGLIFFLLTILRPLPFFAHGTDTLMDHAGELFKRSEGAPQLAKSLAVTVAALGVGAAVAVAGSNAVGSKSRADNGDAGTFEQDANSGRGRTGKTGRTGTAGLPGAAGQSSGGGIDVHEVRLLEPIVYPSPITVSGPTSVGVDPTSLRPIEDALRLLRPPNSSAPLTGPALDQKITETATKAAANQIAATLGPIDLPELKKRTNELYGLNLPSKVADWESWKTTFAVEFAKNMGVFKDDVAATKAAVEDLRNNSFERLQNSGGRSFLTRTTQVLKPDKHLITSQSLKALRSLMVKIPLNVCPTPSTAAATSAKMECCGNQPTKAEYSCNLDIDAIITKLSSMIGDPPQSESDFMRELRKANRVDGTAVDKSTVDRWKTVILKYTRVSY